MNGALQTAAFINGDSPSKVPTVRWIATTQVKLGDVKGALDTAATIPKEYDRASVMRDVAVAQAEGDVKGALQTAATIPETSQKAFALSGIGAAQAKAGDVKGALAWTDNESSPLVKSQALLGVARGILDRIFPPASPSD
jgi:hypothetical protein